MSGESPQISGAIPLTTAAGQQQQQTASQGVDILNQLLQQRNQLNEGIGQLTKAATVPTAGAGPGTSPALAIPAVHPYQQQPMMDKPVTGGRAAKAQGIGNAIIAASNVVGQYAEKHEQEQQRVLAVDIERVFQAQDGIREAQQALQLDPNNADAKNTLQKNSGIIDAMLSDPSRRKKIEKALDVSFTDPSKNDKMEHGALKQAASSYSQQLQKQIPQQMQPNVVAQQKLQMMTQQQQAIDKMIGQIAPTLIREQGAQNRAVMSDTTKRDIASANISNREAIAKLGAVTRYQSAVDSANIRSNAMLKGVMLRNAQSASNTQAIIQNRLDLMQKKQDDPVYQLRGTVANLQQITRESNSLNQQNKTLIAQKQQLMVRQANGQISKEESAKQQAGLDDAIKLNNQAISDYKRMHDQGSAYIENLTKGLQSGNSTGNNTSSSGKSGTSTAEQPKVGASEDTEDTDLDPDDF